VKITNILYDIAADLLRKIFNWRISGPPVFETHESFSSLEPFSNECQIIRAEALNIAENISAAPLFHEIMSQQSDISANDKLDWRMFIIKAYGVIIPKNAARCPVLAELVS
jgi:aspartate beta-hydroxylase